MDFKLKHAMDAAKLALKGKRTGISMTIGVDATGRVTRATEGACVDEFAFRKAAPATSRIFRATRTATGIEVSALGFNATSPSVPADFH